MIQIVISDQSVRGELVFFEIYKIKKLLTENILFKRFKVFRIVLTIVHGLNYRFARAFRKFQKQFFPFPEKW